MLRLVQLEHPVEGRRVAMVEEPYLRVQSPYNTVYHLAQSALGSGRRLAELAASSRSPQTLEYDALYELRSPWQLEEPRRCLVSGTGLTQRASAENRQSVHATTGPSAESLSGSMKMYRIGLEGGRSVARG